MLKNKVLLIIFCITMLSVTVLGCTSNKDYKTLQDNLKSAQREYDLLKSQMTSLQKEYDTNKVTLEAEIARQSAAIAEAKNTNATLKNNIADLQSKLDATLDTQVKFTYTFKYQTQQLTWGISIPFREYLYYKDKSRIPDSSKYTAMVTDNHADSLINILVQKIKDTSLANNLKKTDTIDLVGAFVQSLINSNQETSTPYDDRPLYPIETLWEQGGDSEDVSILTATLLQKLEYNVVYFVFDNPKHVALGIDVPAPGKQQWEFQAKQYVYLETTGRNWLLGNCPIVYSTLQPKIYPIGK